MCEATNHCYKTSISFITVFMDLILIDVTNKSSKVMAYVSTVLVGSIFKVSNK